MAEWTAAAEEFCRPETDRRGYVIGRLKNAGIPHTELVTDPFRHVLVSFPDGCYRDRNTVKVCTAHYDRVPGSPGANDNGAAVLQLLDFAERLARKDITHNIRILFTDGEELEDSQSFTDQGAYFLGKALAGHLDRPWVFCVFDMCGIGTAPVWSFASRKVHPVFKARFAELILRHTSGRDRESPILFSDNAGLALAGHPAVLVSLLPDGEAEDFIRNAPSLDSAPGDGGGKSVGEWAAALRRCVPPAWSTAHSPHDLPEDLEERSFSRMERLLDDLAVWQLGEMKH
jgi:hypothetical protein